MTGEVATKFAGAMQSLAVIRLFPSAERSRSGRQSSVDSEISNQTIDRQSRHVAAIPSRGFFERTGEQAHLRHRKRTHLRGDIAAREFDGCLERRGFGLRAAAFLSVRGRRWRIRGRLLRRHKRRNSERTAE